MSLNPLVTIGDMLHSKLPVKQASIIESSEKMLYKDYIYLNLCIAPYVSTTWACHRCTIPTIPVVGRYFEPRCLGVILNLQSC